MSNAGKTLAEQFFFFRKEGERAETVEIPPMENHFPLAIALARVQFLHKSTMPTLEMQLPDTSPKSLIRRQGRTAAVIAIERASMLGQTLLALRRAQREVSEALTIAEPKEKAALAGALCKIAEQRRILLRLPGPPTARVEEIALSRSMAGTAGRTSAPIVELGEQAEQVGPGPAAEPSAEPAPGPGQSAPVVAPGPAAEREQPA